MAKPNARPRNRNQGGNDRRKSRDAPAGNRPKKQDKDWKVRDEASFLAALSSSAHYSSKLVNSMAPGVGVRLAKDESIGLPLVGLISTKASRRNTDYVNGAEMGAPLSQCMTVINGVNADRYKEGAIPDAQKELIRKHVEMLDQRSEFGTQKVSGLLRQVLFPVATDDAGYVALTPLHSSIFSAILAGRVADEAERRKANEDAAYRKTTRILVGGTKSQNVGRSDLSPSVRSLLFFGAPTESYERRRAYALFYGGIRVDSLIRYSDLKKLVTWRKNHGLGDKGAKSNMHTRNEEEEMVEEIGRNAILRIETERDLMRKNLDVETADGWASSRLDDFTRSLADESLRGRKWHEELAERLLRIIEGFKLSANEKPLSEYGGVGNYMDMLLRGMK